jgi:UDP-N-acetyl-D-glucosamine dehydrogenase
MKVSVIGQGYVGLTVALGAASAGHEVIGFDTNPNLIESLICGDTHVPGINKFELIELIKLNRYKPTTDPKNLNESSTIVIAVPTPLNQNRKPDLSYIDLALESIANFVENSTLIINESTSYPGTLRNYIKPKLESKSKVKFQFASAPERVDPGNENWKLSNTPRVISGITSEDTDKAINFYSTFCDNIYRAPNCEVAEASKIFENTFRQINIALVNEFSQISEKLGFSASEAIKAAATKPFGFMPFFPSIGVGGHCIPVDPTYLSYIANKFGSEANFIELANQTNLLMPKNVALRIKRNFGGSLEGQKIQVAGIAYKPNVPDMRESPAIQLIEELKLLGATVIWHDPLVQEYQNEKSVQLDTDIDIGLIVTPHESINFLIWSKSKVKVLDLSANSSNYGWPKFL